MSTRVLPCSPFCTNPTLVPDDMPSHSGTGCLVTCQDAMEEGGPVGPPPAVSMPGPVTVSPRQSPHRIIVPHSRIPRSPSPRIVPCRAYPMWSAQPWGTLCRAGAHCAHGRPCVTRSSRRSCAS